MSHAAYIQLRPPYSVGDPTASQMLGDEPHVLNHPRTHLLQDQTPASAKLAGRLIARVYNYKKITIYCGFMIYVH